VFELALTQLTVEALPEIMQFDGEGFQLHVDGLAQPRDIQALERLLFSFHGHQFVAEAAAANAVVEVQFADCEALAYLPIDPELVAVAAQAGRSAVRTEFQEVWA